MFYSMKGLSGFLVVGALLFSAFKSSEITPSDSISLGLHQSGRLDSGVVVRLDSIQDSRCPTGATCIWAGQATVKLLLSKSPDSTTVLLSLGPPIKQDNAESPYSTTVSLNNQCYKVILQEVTPFPNVLARDQFQMTIASRMAVVQVTTL